jgi:signal transduction histidine kinase/DNA-binding NarL/FixJ family response regulator
LKRIQGHSSIRARMSLTMAATVFACTMLTVLAFLFADFRQSIDAEKMRLENTASVFAASVSRPAARSDEAEVREALRGIRDIAHVRHIAVHDLQGRLIAEMGGGTILDESRAKLSEVTVRNMFFLDHLTVGVPVRSGGRLIGSVSMQAGIGWIRDDFNQRVQYSLLLSMLGIALAFSMAFRRVLGITGPLQELSQSFADIGERIDLNKRLESSRDDEVGVLVGAFNDMLDRIAERDMRLQVHRDTLELTVAERTSDLVEAKEVAERANAAKSEFLAMVGHEIRTPMNGMMVMAEMLAAAPLGPRHLRYAEIINRSGRNLLSIINDMLDLSKIESGRLDLENAPFSIDALIEDVTGLFAERAREKQLALTYTINPNVPAKLLGDATRLTQVITNLVNNALKFTETGGVSINVAGALGARNATAHLTIRVQDTGIGIASEKLSHVFERFAQADQTITRRFGGTGLGLAISKRLVEAMRGSIIVDSQEGTGSTFTVKLSLAVEEQVEPMPTLSGKRIAISQRERIHADAIRAMLQRMGAMVVELDGTIAQTQLDLIMSEDDVSDAARIKCPVLKLTPLDHASKSDQQSSVHTHHAEISFPLSRSDFRMIGQALQTGNMTLFPARSGHQLQGHALPDFRGLKALVVDDNAVNREVLQEALTSMGARTILANDGTEALLQMREHSFDIVFMDCSMPVMDGFTATRQWRGAETGARLPIIALTAYAEGSAGEDWKLAGMDDYVTKPFTIPALAATIIRLLPNKLSGAIVSNSAGKSGMDTAEIAQLPLLDPQTMSMIDTLSKRNGGAAARRIFSLFEEHAPLALERFGQSVSGTSPAEIKSLAHALKSMCSSAGALRLSALAGECETRVEKMTSIDRPLLDALSGCLRETIEAIRRRFDVVVENDVVALPPISVQA